MKLNNGVRKLSEEDLKEVTVENATGDTTMGPKNGISNYTEFRGEVWKERVLQYAEPLRVMEQAALVNDDLVNSGDYQIHIPYATSHLNISLSSTNTEGSERAFTKMDNLDTTSVSITSSDFSKGGVAISKEAVMTSTVDLVKQARYAIAEDLVDDVDTAVRDVIENNAGSTVSSSGALTPDAIAEAMKSIEANNFVPKMLFITPSQQYDLRTDSQFTNASEYGSDEVVMNGEIGKYLGVKILVSTNVSADTALMVGTTRSGEKVGPVLVWKEKPHIDYRYDKDEAEHRIYYDQCFTTTYLRSGAMVKIDTS